MINLSGKCKNILIGFSGLILVGLLSGCNQQVNAKTNVSLNASIITENKTMAVVVKNNELGLIYLNDNNKNVTLDKDGVFSHPIISNDKKFIAYLKDNNLYVTSKEGEKSKIFDNINISSYAWLDKSNLLYSKDTGGIYVFNVEKQNSSVYLENKFNYKNITIGKNSMIYAEKYNYYEKEGKKYLEDFGVVTISDNNKNEKLIIKSIPSDMDTNLGMYPIIAGISKDYKFLYILEHPHAGSLAADGISFTSYNTESDKYTKYSDPEIITLAYKDNFSSSKVNSEFVALINGNDRLMNTNKTLGILNLVNGKFEKLSSENQVAMTPYYSEDGKVIMYSASKKLSNDIIKINDWLNSPHYIYSVNTDNKQITQITNSTDGFDFAPEYINKEEIVFLRRTSNDVVALWKSKNGKETKIIDNLIFYTDNFKKQNLYGHFYNNNFIDIK